MWRGRRRLPSRGPRWAGALVVMLALWLVARGARAEEAGAFGVDLHAHVFMKPGLGAFYRGSFDERQADSWDDRLSSKIDAASLEASGLQVVVVSLFAHPVFRWDVRAAIWEQIHAARRFVATHSGWGLARSPAEARTLLAAGKRVMVLSLEGASGVLESEADLRAFVDEGGVSIVTAIHLVDDRYGGAATMGGFKFFGNPLGVVDRLLHPSPGAIGTNHRGLSSAGRRLVVELVRRGVWIDLTHASDRAATELLALVEAAGQPVLVSHTPLREDRPVERSIAPATLAAIGRTGGMLGLLPSEDAFDVVREPAPPCPQGCSVDACRGGVAALARAWTEAVGQVEAPHVTLGTDFNGGMRHLAASCGAGGTLEREPGLFHAGQLRELWRALRARGAPVAPAHAHVEAFLSAWERVHPRALPDQGLPPLPPASRALGPSLAASLTLGAGAFADAGVLHGAAAFALRKDQGQVFAADPVIELLRLRGAVDVAPTSGDIATAYGSVALVGIGAAWHDDQLDAEALAVDVEAARALGLRRRLQVTAVRGRARTMPGLAKAPGQHQLFVELGAELLGYERILLADARELDGVFLVGGSAGLGFRGAVGGGWDLALAALARGDLTALVGVEAAGFAFQSDLRALGRASLGRPGVRFFFEGGGRAQRVVALPSLLEAVPVFTGGISLHR